MLGGSGKSLELKQTAGSGERHQKRGQWSLLKLRLVHMFIIPAFGEVEAELSGGKGHLWLQSKFKASLNYMVLCLQKKKKRELEVQEDFEHGKNIFIWRWVMDKCYMSI